MARSLTAWFLASLVLSGSIAAQTTSVRIQVFDVGQADGILIRTPNSEWVLIDGSADRFFADSLRDRYGVDRLRWAVGSHRHLDHLGGMDEVLGKIPTDLYVGDTLDRAAAFDDHVRDTIINRGITVQPRGAYSQEIDGVLFTVLPQGPRVNNENNNSIVVRMDYGEFSMLFPGDLETPGQNWLIQNHPDLLDVDVLKASHHGADNGVSDAWLQAVSPDHVVISVGVDWNHTHPDSAAVRAYEHAAPDRLFCTHRHGTIRIYGWPDGRTQLRKQWPGTQKPCYFDGTVRDEVGG